MATLIALLRGVNVGGHHKIKMEKLRALYESLGMANVRTYVQSGNVVFQSPGRNLPAIAKKLENAIDAEFGFRPDVILRTGDEMEDVVKRNPFAERNGIEPAKLAVFFLGSDPASDGIGKIDALQGYPEEIVVSGREIYIYFPSGMGQTKLPLVMMGKAVATPSTTRNWNTIVKLLEMARN